jgi:hypothetical protein
MPAMLLLEKLARVNRTAIFLISLAVFLGALFIGGILGGLILLVIAGLLGAMLVQTWPLTPPGMRILRVVVLVLLVITGLTFVFK